MRTVEVKRGAVVEYRGTIYQVRDIERSTPTARGGNVTFRFILYSVPGGHKFNLSLRADDELKEINLTRRQAGFSYKDGETFVFMDAENYSQYLLAPEIVGDNARYISAGLEDCFIQLIDDQPVALQVPTTVKLGVIDTAPALKGGSATRRSKPARLETGIEVQVPDYIGIDDKILVNTLNGEYAGRT